MLSLVDIRARIEGGTLTPAAARGWTSCHAKYAPPPCRTVSSSRSSAESRAPAAASSCVLLYQGPLSLMAR